MLESPPPHLLRGMAQPTLSHTPTQHTHTQWHLQSVKAGNAHRLTLYTALVDLQ